MTKFSRQRGLFGGFEPEPRDPRGRKRITWAKQTAEKVTVLAALRRSQEEIAAEVGLSVKTLARIYAGELEAAAKLLRQAVFEGQVRKATEKGSTPAARFVLAELDKELAAERHQELGGSAPRPAKAPRLGKKEQAQLTAQQALDGVYAPGPAPKMVN